MVSFSPTDFFKFSTIPLEDRRPGVRVLELGVELGDALLRPLDAGLQLRDRAIACSRLVAG
jgi:hypothetical protein